MGSRWSVEETADQPDLDIAQVDAATEYYDDHTELMETLRTQKAARKQSIADQSRAEQMRALVDQIADPSPGDVVAALGKIDQVYADSSVITRVSPMDGSKQLFVAGDATPYSVS